MELLLFSLPLAAPRGNWRSGPIKASAPTEIPSALRILWGPTCVSARARVTTAQLLVALPSYGCGVLPAGKRNARKEEPVEHW